MVNDVRRVICPAAPPGQELGRAPNESRRYVHRGVFTKRRLQAYASKDLLPCNQIRFPVPRPPSYRPELSLSKSSLNRQLAQSKAAPRIIWRGLRDLPGYLQTKRITQALQELLGCEACLFINAGHAY